MTRQQKWAQAAFKAVSAQRGATTVKDYSTYCMKLPSLLLQSGLVQTTAFLRSRGKEAATHFLDDVANVLAGVEGQKAGQKLDDEARRAELREYLRLSRDALTVATWFRRFAQSELGAELDGES